MAYNCKTVIDIKKIHMTKIVDKEFSSKSLPNDFSHSSNIREVTVKKLRKTVKTPNYNFRNFLSSTTKLLNIN